MTAPIVGAAILLAFANGANDNFKGVATLYGSGALSRRSATAWATVTTFAGSLVSIALASALVPVFSGVGIVPTEIATATTFQASAGWAAALTILTASALGLPTSTTHALIGALVGASLAVDRNSVAWAALADKLVAPMLVGPLVAIALTWLVFRALAARSAALRRGPTCLCITPELSNAAESSTLACIAASPSVVVGAVAECERTLGVQALRLRSDQITHGVHLLSAGAVCFARAVNDTPKVAALLLATGVAGTNWSLTVVALAMVLGGLVASRRVADTMSLRITSLDAPQALSANLVTAGLVLAASRLGLPMSTTHVSCGAMFGIGVAKRSARWSTILAIASAWIVTLPLAALVAALLHMALSRAGA